MLANCEIKGGFEQGKGGGKLFLENFYGKKTRIRVFLTNDSGDGGSVADSVVKIKDGLGNATQYST